MLQFVSFLAPVQALRREQRQDRSRRFELPRGRRAAPWTLAIWLAAATICIANPPTSRTFDESGTVWQLLDSNHSAHIVGHEHLAGGARNDNGCERIVISAPAGHSSQLGCPVPHFAVLDELHISLWVKASVPHVRIGARVVMPRSVNRDGGPATAVLRGVAYDQPGHWQQLVLKDAPKLLAAEVRTLRAVPGAKVDPREAYLDCVVLVIPGDPGGVEIVTDELEVDGVVVASEAIQLASFPAASAAAAQQPQARQSMHSEPAAVVNNRLLPRLQGSTLMVSDAPFLPRAIQWQGEPLEFLANCGFNTIQLRSAPTAEQSAEASRRDLWFICGPPRPDEIRRHGLGRDGDRVLAWQLEEEALESDQQYVRSWVELIRQNDRARGRPVLLPGGVGWPAASKLADIVAVRHWRAAQMAVNEYNEWLSGALAMSEPGVPFFTCVPTQWGEQVRQQAEALTGLPADAVSVDDERLRAMVRTACAQGSGGILFSSQSRLDENYVGARRRAATLELVNRKLQLIEPWLAAGTVSGHVNSVDKAWSGVLLQVDQARLLIPLKAELFGQNRRERQSTGPPTGDVVFVVPGIPESSKGFSLSAVAFRPLVARRVAGGTRIVLPASECDDFVLITEDPAVIQSFRRRIARDGPRFARLEYELSKLQAGAAREVQQQMTRIGLRGEQSPATHSEATLISHPLRLGADQLTGYAEFSQTFDRFHPGENLLYGGDFEDLGQMTQVGWQHVRDETSGIVSGARLSPAEPRHGALSLELFAAATGAEAPRVVASPPAWVISPPVPVEEGSIVEVTGWVRIEEPISGSIDGLQIFDSLGGPELSLAVHKTSGWEKFQLIRGVPAFSELRLTFALSGIGSARVDGVMVRVLERPVPRRLPPVSPLDRSATHEVEGFGQTLVTPETR